MNIAILTFLYKFNPYWYSLYCSNERSISNKLSKNELLMISVFVSLLVALVDLYGDVFRKQII